MMPELLSNCLGLRGIWGPAGGLRGVGGLRGAGVLGWDGLLREVGLKDEEKDTESKEEALSVRMRNDGGGCEGEVGKKLMFLSSSRSLCLSSTELR